jgi:hypothetical protein
MPHPRGRKPVAAFASTLGRDHPVRKSALVGPLLLLALVSSRGEAATDAQPSRSAPAGACFAAGHPPYSDPPLIQIWSPQSPNRSAGGAIPVCAGIGQGPFKELVALAGRFRYGGDGDGLLARFGAVSRFAGLRFWAIGKQRWDVLIEDAHALNAPYDDGRRPDFRPQEMQPGSDLFFSQEDAGAADPVIYRLHVEEVAPEHILLTVENTNSVRMLLFPIFGSGDLRILYRLEKIAPGEWGFYSVLQLGPGTSVLAENREDSYANRMMAVFRHIAGIPDTLEPPAARGQEPQSAYNPLLGGD